MEYPKRRHPRLKNYDYSLPGYYYVTIHTKEATPFLSRVGRGLAPAGAVVSLTQYGKIAQQELYALERRYSNVRVDKYVIMPTHIHMILQLTEIAAGASPRPTLMDVVRAYKSMTTRVCNQIMNTPGTVLFQTSFYETVLRNEAAYQQAWRYIDENPDKWLLKSEDL